MTAIPFLKLAALVACILFPALLLLFGYKAWHERISRVGNILLAFLSAFAVSAGFFIACAVAIAAVSIVLTLSAQIINGTF